MDLAASDLHDLADRNGLITPDVEHSFQDQVCIQSGGSKGRGVACLEGQREQDSGVERAVVVRIARQNQPVGQGFGINRVQNRPCSIESVGMPWIMKKPPKSGVFELGLER